MRSTRTIGPAAAALLVAVAGTAFAGDCPADKVVPAGQGQAMGATAPMGVTDMVLAAIDLAHEIPGMEGRKLRTRMLEVQPGGVVPWHSHVDRPALIYIVAGEITEYSSRCLVPIVHSAGEVSTEEGGEEHWWKNEGGAVARLLATDIVHEQQMQQSAKM
jgi:quercetin dioxygenase-like cupin family protein